MSYQLATLAGAGWVASAAGAHTPTAYFRATYYSARIITLSPQRQRCLSAEPNTTRYIPVIVAVTLKWHVFSEWDSIKALKQTLTSKG